MCIRDRANGGSIRNTGVEVSIQVTPVSTKDFQWVTNINYSSCLLYTSMNPMIEEQLIYFYDSGYDRLHHNTNGQERMAHTLMYQLLSLPASF